MSLVKNKDRKLLSKDSVKNIKFQLVFDNIKQSYNAIRKKKRKESIYLLKSTKIRRRSRYTTHNSKTKNNGMHQVLPSH